MYLRHEKLQNLQIYSLLAHCNYSAHLFPYHAVPMILDFVVLLQLEILKFATSSPTIRGMPV